MKKLFSYFTILIALMIMTVSPVWAADSTATVGVAQGATVNTIWNGANGTFTLNGQIGNGASVNVGNGGVSFSGNVNLGATIGSYGYGVDNTSTNIKAGFAGSGYVNFSETRLVSPLPSPLAQYVGLGPQLVYGSVSSNQTGEMAMNLSTNYVQMGVYNYAQPVTTNGKQFEATGTFAVQTGVATNGYSIVGGAVVGGNQAYLTNSGTGSTKIDYTASDFWALPNPGSSYGGPGGQSFNFGRNIWGTNAVVNATGSGLFNLGGQAITSLSAPGLGVTLPGGGSFSLPIIYNNGLNVANFNVIGN